MCHGLAVACGLWGVVVVHGQCYKIIAKVLVPESTGAGIQLEFLFCVRAVLIIKGSGER